MDTAIDNISQKRRIADCPPYIISTTEIHDNMSREISLDPGIATFITGVDTNGNIYRFGYDWKTWVLAHRDILNNDGTPKTIKDLISEMQKHTSEFISNNFDLVVMPILDVTRSKVPVVAEGAKMLNHPLFYQKLSKMSKVIVVDESYTSSTCYRCDRWKNTKWNRYFSCDSCLLHIDRDVHGCLNIWKRYLEREDDR